MSTTSMNGQRKTLATQLDRLDRILDGLAEALNEAVSDAVRQSVGTAVGEAVQAAVKEVLTHPELLRAAAAGRRRARRSRRRSGCAARPAPWSRDCPGRRAACGTASAPRSAGDGG